MGAFFILAHHIDGGVCQYKMNCSISQIDGFACNLILLRLAAERPPNERSSSFIPRRVKLNLRCVRYFAPKVEATSSLIEVN